MLNEPYGDPAVDANKETENHDDGRNRTYENFQDAVNVHFWPLDEKIFLRYASLP